MEADHYGGEYQGRVTPDVAGLVVRDGRIAKRYSAG
jgi:hypothetical protein